MIFEELHRRYGSRLAMRLQRELNETEFARVNLRNLQSWLTSRAQNAQKEYHVMLDNPFSEEVGMPRDTFVSTLYRRWRDAEELSCLVAIAEDVTTRARAAGGK